MEQAGASGPSPGLSPGPVTWPRRAPSIGLEPQGMVVGRSGWPGRLLRFVYEAIREERGICMPRQKPGSPVPLSTAAGATLTLGASREYWGMWCSKAA